MDTRGVDRRRVLLEQRRARTLASDARAGSWARGRARRVQREYLRERWRQHVVFLAGFAAMAFGVSWLMPTSFLKGLVVGGLLVTGPTLLWSWTVQVTGTAPVMMGDMAEQWTAGLLRKMQPHGWRILNRFVLERDDVDHLAISRGGVLVVETKWSATDWHSQYGRARLVGAVEQVKDSARILRLWHPVKSRQIGVDAVVVLWGGGTNRTKRWPESQQVVQRDGVTVVTGEALLPWLRDREAAHPAAQVGNDLGEQQTAELWRALDTQVRRRDPLEERDHPVPASIEQIVLRLGLSTLAAVGGLLYLGLLARVIDGSWLLLAVGAVSTVPAGVMLRASVARHIAWGWLFGLGVPVGALTIAELVYRSAL